MFANPEAEPLIDALLAKRKLARIDVEAVVFGVATDFCVKAAALGLRQRGFDVAVVTDAIAAITPEGEAAALAEMTHAGCKLIRHGERSLREGARLLARMKKDLPFHQPLAVAVDVVVFTVIDRALSVLLTLRPRTPFKDRWSLPGGFVGAFESSDTAAERELTAKTSIEGVFLEQLYTFSEPARDPRTRVISVAYYALVASTRLAKEGGSRESRWFEVDTDTDGRARIEGKVVELAFDHAAILETAIARIRGKLAYAPIGFQLLPERFTLTEIQQVHEAILGKPIDKRNFRRKLLESGLVREVNAYRTGPHRPARLYTFTDRTF